MARPRDIPDVDVKLIDSIFVKTSLSYTSKDIMERLWGAKGLLTTSKGAYDNSQQQGTKGKEESKSEPDQAPKYLISNAGAETTQAAGYIPDLVFLGNAMILRPYIQPARTVLSRSSTSTYKVE